MWELKTSLVMGNTLDDMRLRTKLSDLGYASVTDDVIQTAFGKFKILADKKKHVYDEDIIALVDDSLIKESNVINLKSLKVFAGTESRKKAEMTLEVYGDVKRLTKLEMVQLMLYLNVLKSYIHTMLNFNCIKCTL